MKSIAIGLCAAGLLFALVTGAFAQNAYTGTWHQPAGPSGCAGRDAYEANILLDGHEINGYLSGSFAIACSNNSGRFKTTGEMPYARVENENLVITAQKGTYRINQKGEGTLVTSSGHQFPLKMEKSP